MSVDLIIHNGRVLTMDQAQPRAEAIAISQGRIIEVGRSSDLLALAGPKTTVIDAESCSILPGLIDSHIHIFSGGAEMDNLDLTGVHGFDSLMREVAKSIATSPGHDIIVGNQANYDILGGGETLSRLHLDRMSPDRAILIYSPDHHTAWANTIALSQAGILQGRILPAGHEIVMGADGLATGELREPEAIGPVEKLQLKIRRARLGLTTGGEPEPYPSPQDFETDIAIVKRALKKCAALGLTSFHNMDGNLYTIELLAALERRGELTARARVPFHFKPFMALAALERASTMAAAYHSDMLQASMVKVFMDGVLDSGTAVMLDDYEDRAGWRGEPLFSQEAFNAMAIEADRRGLQIAVHAIGDGAVNMVLNGYEAAHKINGARDSRHRIEHIEVVARSDISRFKALGVIASMQPPHPPGAQGLPFEPTISKIGRAKWPLSYVWNDFRQAEVPLVFGTDWPVSDLNPLRSIGSAMTRESWAVGLSSHQQTLHQSLHSYTVMGAYAGFAEGKTGQLAKGLYGDCVVLDGDIEATPAEQVSSLSPRFTVVQGRVVYQRD